MNRIDFEQVEFLTFDCYGTLIDWESGILTALKPILDARGLEAEDDRILEVYGRLESEAEAAPYRPYREVLRDVMIGFGRRFGFQASIPEISALIESVASWPAFDDSKQSLSELAKRFRLVALSNVDDHLFEGSNDRLGRPFDHVFTAQKIGSYKPDPANFHYAIERLGSDMSAIVHVAQSLFHDIQPANRIGLRTIWINRRHDRTGPGATPPAVARPDQEFPTLDAFVNYLNS
jgi:2-haloacid dehalogenase